MISANSKKDLGIGAFGIIMSALVLFWSRNFKKDDVIYIYCLVALLTLLSLIHLLNTLKTIKMEKADGIQKQEKAKLLMTKKQFIVCVLFVVYVLGYYVLGFVIASVLLMILIPLLMNYRKPVPILISAVIVVAVIYEIFFGYLKLPDLSGVLFR